MDLHPRFYTIDEVSAGASMDIICIWFSQSPELQMLILR